MARKFSAGGLVFNIILYAVFLLFVFLCLYPFYYILIYSVSDTMQAVKGVTFFPRGLTFTNYAKIFELPGIALATLVSIFRTVVGGFVTVLCCAFFGYLMTKQKMYGRKIIYRFFVVTMYLNAGLIPTYLVMRAYHLNNNLLIYILPFALVPYYVILIKTFIEQIPPALEESAKMDGAGLLTIFFRLIIPLSAPIIATIAVFAAVGQWNSYFDNLIYMVGSKQFNTLQLILYQYISRAATVSNSINIATAQTLAQQVSPDTIRMTITMIVTLPILFVYPIAQKFFVKGIMMGAVKG